MTGIKKNLYPLIQSKKYELDPGWNFIRWKSTDDKSLTDEFDFFRNQKLGLNRKQCLKIARSKTTSFDI